MPLGGMLGLVMVLHHRAKRTEVDNSDGMLAPLGTNCLGNIFGV